MAEDFAGRFVEATDRSALVGGTFVRAHDMSAQADGTFVLVLDTVARVLDIAGPVDGMFVPVPGSDIAALGVDSTPLPAH